MGIWPRLKGEVTGMPPGKWRSSRRESPRAKKVRLGFYSRAREVFRDLQKEGKFVCVCVCVLAAHHRQRFVFSLELVYW